MSHTKIQNMTRCALAASLMTVCAWITVPGPIPFTLQTFALFLILDLLGGKQGSWAIAVYLGLGIVGMPVFSGFRGGISMLLGATGGYLSGFMLTSLLYWLLTKLTLSSLPALVLSYVSCYCFGTVWYLLTFAGGKSLGAVLSSCVFPFVIPDAMKLALAHALAKRLKKVIRA